MTSRVTIQAGVCGFRTDVAATCEDSQNVAFAVTSDCAKISALAAQLAAQGAVDAYAEISPAGSGPLLGLCRSSLKGCCAGCVVPAGLFKAMQVAAGLALPKDISIAMQVEA